MPAITWAPLFPLPPIHGPAHSAWETLPAKWIHQPSLHPTFSGNWECAVHWWMIMEEWVHIHYRAKMFLRTHNEPPAVARALVLQYQWFKCNQKALQGSNKDLWLVVLIVNDLRKCMQECKDRSKILKVCALKLEDLLLVSLSGSLGWTAVVGSLLNHFPSLYVSLDVPGW